MLNSQQLILYVSLARWEAFISIKTGMHVLNPPFLPFSASSPIFRTNEIFPPSVRP